MAAASTSESDSSSTTSSDVVSDRGNQPSPSSLNNPFDTDGSVDSVGVTRTPSIASASPEESVEEVTFPQQAVIRDGTRRSAPPPPVERPALARQAGPATQQDEIQPVESLPFEEVINEKYQIPGDEEAGAAERRIITDKEKQEEDQQASTEQKKRGPFGRFYHGFRNIYCPLEEPPLVLPIAPNDTEKLSYLYMGRFVFFAFGIFSFMSLGAGMWLFSVTTKYYYWYSLFAGISCIYLIMSYGIGLIGRDYDYKAHLERVAAHPITDETAPTVDIFLPCCHEPLEILENTYRHIRELDWPASKITIYVMDDGAQESVRTLAESYGFTYRVRDDRPHLRKAGNLRWNFAHSDGDFFVIFDADFCPRPDFVKELAVEHLADDKTAIVQSPQWFRSTSEQTWVEQGAGATQELFYRVIQVNRDKWGGAICVGTNAMYRRAALVDVGGTADIGHSEDVHTGYGAIDRGWKVKYIPLNLAAGICPNTPKAFFSQQMRWATGSTTLLSNPRFWISKLSMMQKLCYFSGFLFYLTSAMNIFSSPIPGIMLLALKPEWVKVWNIAFAIPSFLYGLVVIPLWARSRYSYNVQHAMTVQSYAYLCAIKDRVFSIDAPWAVSGDAKAHKSNKHRNMRIFGWIWVVSTAGATVGLCVWRYEMGMPWYDPLPLLIVTVYNILKTHYFLFCSW